MNRKIYLDRIGIEKQDVIPDLETLKSLQRQHLLNVPFENLDIQRKRPIILNGKRFFDKIIGEKRGGFCYELNGLFYELLKEIGFQSKIISAKVSQGNGDFGAEFDHLAIITRIETNEYLVDVGSRIETNEYVVDVGFGSFTAAPLKFVLNVEQTDDCGVFLIRKFDDEYFEVVKKNGDGWQSEYVFSGVNRDLQEFAEMCEFHQTSPESHFTRGKVCSLLTLNGRKTLTDKRFIETKNGQKTETDIASVEHFNEILEREFNIKA